MLTVPAPQAVTANCDSNCADPCSPGCVVFLPAANCDSNCADPCSPGCVLVLPVTNCGDNDCSSCVCIVPVSPTGALMIFAAEGAMLMLAVESGRIAGGYLITA